MKREDLFTEVDVLVNGCWVESHYLDDPEGLLQAVEDEMDLEDIDLEALIW